jgi:hypothetical protein
LNITSGCDINREWKNGKLPMINGIIYQDGNIDWVNVDINNEERKIEFTNKLHINDLLFTNGLQFLEAVTLMTLEDTRNEVTICCGGCGLGGGGFVVVESKNESQLKWIAVFENSNPFERVEVAGEIIYAYNKSADKWGFNINKPGEISINK